MTHSQCDKLPINRAIQVLVATQMHVHMTASYILGSTKIFTII